MNKMNSEKMSEKIEAILVEKYSIGEADYLHQMIFDDECTKEDVVAFMDYVHQCSKQDTETDIDAFDKALQEMRKNDQEDRDMVACLNVKVNQRVYFEMNGSIYEGTVKQIKYSHDAVVYDIEVQQIGTMVTLKYDNNTKFGEDNTMFASVMDVFNGCPIAMTNVPFTDLLKQCGFTIKNGCVLLYYWSGTCPISYYANPSLFVIKLGKEIKVELKNDDETAHILYDKMLYKSIQELMQSIDAQ